MCSEVKLGLVVGALALGEAIGLGLEGFSAFWPLAFCLALPMALLGYGRSLRLWPLPVIALVGISLAWHAADRRTVALREVDLRNGFCESSFVVEAAPEIRGTAERWASFPSNFAGVRVRPVFRLEDGVEPPRKGEVWHCAGWLEKSRGDERRRRIWVRGGGTYAVREREVSPYSLGALLERVRDSLSARLAIGLEDNPRAVMLLRAMLLGERAEMPWKLRETFVRAGTVHVFAISGLHVMVVVQVMLVLLSLTGFPYRWTALVLVPMLWAYVVMIGAPPSAVRAAAMASIWQAAPIFWRRPNALAALEWTAIVFACVDPLVFFSVGSLLSFAVMGGILLFLRWSAAFKSRLLDGFGVPFAAWASGLPIVARVFSRVCIGGFFANLVLVPCAFAAVFAGVLGLFASFVSNVLAAHLNNLAALFADAMTGISYAVAGTPKAEFEVEPWSLWQCAAWYAVCALSMALIRMVVLRRRSALA